MNKKLLGLLFLYIVLLISCKSQVDKYPPGSTVVKPDIKINKKKHVNGFNLSVFTDSIDYIPLNIDSNTVIGKINKVLLLKNRFVVFDADLARGVFLFDKKGQLLKKIYRDQNADYKIFSIEDVAVDYDENKIFIYSGAESNISVMDSNGILEKKIPMEKGYFSTFERTNAGFVFYRELETLKSDDPYGNFRVCLIDSEGKFLKGWFNDVRNAKFPIPIPGVFFRRVQGSGSVYFQSPHFDSLLVVDDKGKSIDELAFIDFKTPNSARKRFFSAQNIDQFLHALRHSYSLSETPIITSKFIIGSYSIRDGLVYNFYHDKISETTVSLKKFVNDLDNIPIKIDGFSSLSPGKLLSVVDNDRLLGDVELRELNNQLGKSPGKFKEQLENVIINEPEKIVLAVMNLKYEKN